MMQITSVFELIDIRKGCWDQLINKMMKIEILNKAILETTKQYLFRIHLDYIFDNNLIPTIKIMMNLKQQDLENFVKSRVNHQFNQETFNKQLSEQLHKNIYKLEKETIKQMKRKLYLENQQHKKAQKLVEIKKQREIKDLISQKRRDESMERKLNEMIADRKIKRDLFLQRLKTIKERDEEELSRKISKLEQKARSSRVNINPLPRSTSLISQQSYEPSSPTIRKITDKNDNYYTNFDIDKTYMTNKRKIHELLLQRNNLEKRQLSLRSLSKASQGQLQKPTKKGRYFIRNYSEAVNPSDSQKQRPENIEQGQEMKKYFLQKLEGIENLKKQPCFDLKSNIKPVDSESRVSVSRTQNKSSLIMSPVKNSILFDQGDARQKHSYRKQIVQQIKEYMKSKKEQ